jgi:polysaccharide pyruvyl transferase WcaK-like protein
MKRVLLVGYFGMHNCGDDLFVRAAVDGCRRYFQSETFYVNGTESYRTDETLVRPIQFTRRTRQPLQRIHEQREIGRARKSDLLIFPGGSNFHSSATLRHYERLVEAVQGPSAALGVSVGPFREAEAHDDCERLMSKMSFVGLRDRASENRTLDFANREALELTCDLAVPYLRSRFPKPDHGDGSVAICLATPDNPNTDPEPYDRVAEEAISAMRVGLSKGMVGSVKLVDLNGHPIFGDHVLHRRIQEALPSVHVKHIPYTGSSDAVIEHISRASFVLAMRLHALVFAVCLGKPTLVLSYHEKCTEFASLANVDGGRILNVNALRPRQLEEAFTELVRNSESSVEYAYPVIKDNWISLTERLSAR